jgi:hypothetical protein
MIHLRVRTDDPRQEIRGPPKPKPVMRAGTISANRTSRRRPRYLRRCSYCYSAVTIIELRSQPVGRWKVFEAPGVQPVFPDREGALSYADTRMRSRSGEIRIFDWTGAAEEVISFAAPEAHRTVPRGGGHPRRFTQPIQIDNAEQNFISKWATYAPESSVQNCPVGAPQRQR